MRINLKRVLFILTFLLNTSYTYAALSPEEENKFNQQYLSTAEIELEADYTDIQFPKLAFLKRFDRSTVEYKITQVYKTTPEYPIQSGDRLLIDYPSRGKKMIRLAGNFYPWISKTETGAFLLLIRPDDLFPARNRTWILQNHENLFVPLTPKEYWD